MNCLRTLAALLLLFISSMASGQFFVDECFESVTPVNGAEFTNTASVYSVFSTDIIEWTGSDWNGGFSNANLSEPPPSGETGCRAVFLGSSSSWTTGGETLGLLMTDPLVAGQTYSIDFTYISHGLGADGAFQPYIHTNTTPNLGGAFQIGQLPPVGFTWTVNTLTFTATAAQDGHTIFMMGTSPNGSSGLVSSFCNNCQLEPDLECDVDLGPDQTICEGESVVLDATTVDATYEWQDGSTNATFEATTTGTYSVTITVDGCTATDEVDITVQAPPTIDLGTDQTICEGESIVLDATTAGADYLWQDNSTGATFTATTTGTYSVEVTVGLCSVSDDIEITVEPLPQIDLGENTGFCTGESLTLDATWPDADYLWQDGSTDATFEVTTSGTYTVDVATDFCTVTESVDVEVTDPPVVDLGADVTLCEGESLTLDATTPGASYDWQDGSDAATFDVTETGTYSVEVNLNDCIVSDEIAVTFEPLPEVTFTDQETICEGESLTLDATWPDATYLWQDGSTESTFEVTESGNYTVDVATDFCVITAQTEVTVVPLPVVDLGEDVVLCEGESAVLDAGNPGADFLWSNEATTQQVTVTENGDVSVTVTDANGCVSQDDVTVTVNPLPVLELPAEQTICEDETLVLDAGNPGSTYEWSNDATAQQVEVNEEAVYSVTVTNTFGCTAAAATELTVVTYPIVDLGEDQTLCEGESVTLDAGASFLNFNWSNGETTPEITVSESAEYVVTVDNDYCFTTASVNITFNPLPLNPLPEDTAFCFLEPPYDLELNAGNPGSTYAWSTGSTSQTTSVFNGGVYAVEITTPLGCTREFATIVNEICAGEHLFVPNAFTPDFDGVNDVFKAEGDNILEFRIEVWDRWGHMVWSAEDINAHWIGNFQGGDYFVQADVYHYEVQYKYVLDEFGTPSEWVVKKGHVTVVR